MTEFFLLKIGFKQSLKRKPISNILLSIRDMLKMKLFKYLRFEGALKIFYASLHTEQAGVIIQVAMIVAYV